MLFSLIAPIFIPIATLLVPFIYRFLWPRHVVRPLPFFSVSIPIALVLGVGALLGVADFYVGIGISGGTPSAAATAARSHTERLLQIRLLLTLSVAVLAQYAICHLIQLLLRRDSVRTATGSNNRSSGRDRS